MSDLPQCTAEQVLDSAAAVVLSLQPCTSAYVADFVSHPLETTERALQVGEALGFIEKNDNVYRPLPPYRYYLAEASEPRRIDVLRFAVEAYEPYRFFKQRLAVHDDALRAARETKTRFAFDNHEGEIRETLVSLGQYCGSLTYTADSGLKVSTSSAGAEQYLASFESIAVEGASAEEFIREKLGLDGYQFVQDEALEIITNLRTAVQKLLAGEAGTEAIVAMGNACENFEKRIATLHDPPIDLNGATSVISKAERLKSAAAIATKHLGYFTYLGHIRNAQDHGIDDQDIAVNAQWEVSEETVRQAILVCLSTIRTVVAFRNGHYSL